jgi:type I restriction enzyme S subunit
MADSQLAWRELTIGGLCRTVTSGGTPKRDNVSYYIPGTIPWVKTGDLTDGYVLSYGGRISELGLKNSSAKILPVNTVLMAMYGATVGQLGLLAEPATCNQAACAMIADPEVCDPRWLFYVLLNDRTRIMSLATGAAQQNLSGRTIKSFTYLAPPAAEQRAIAEVLGVLDDKIVANEQQIKTADDLLLAYWDRLSSESTPGCTLADLIESSLGGDWGAAEQSDTESEEVFCIRGADIADFQAGRLGKAMPSRFVKRGSLQRRALSDGDLVIEISGGSPTQSTGRAVRMSDDLLKRLNKPVVSSNFCRIVRVRESKASLYVYAQLRRSWERGEFFQYEIGTTGIKNLNFSEYCRGKSLSLPNDESLSKFNSDGNALFRVMQSCGLESTNLAELRDALLPLLVSGTLRVKDAEKGERG